MTDRIQELMETCWDPARGVVNPRKLAYKIIKECAQVSVDCEVNGSTDLREGIAHSILQHFGIKDEQPNI